VGKGTARRLGSPSKLGEQPRPPSWPNQTTGRSELLVGAARIVRSSAGSCPPSSARNTVRRVRAERKFASNQGFGVPAEPVRGCPGSLSQRPRDTISQSKIPLQAAVGGSTEPTRPNSTPTRLEQIKAMAAPAKTAGAAGISGSIQAASWVVVAHARRETPGEGGEVRRPTRLCPLARLAAGVSTGLRALAHG